MVGATACGRWRRVNKIWPAFCSLPMSLCSREGYFRPFVRARIRLRFRVPEYCGIAVTIQTSKPDVLLIDLTPERHLRHPHQLQGSLPNCRIVLWVRAISTELAYQAMELGVRGVLRKTLPPELLIKCLGKVAEASCGLNKTLTASFLSAKMIALTKRESQLVSLLSQGLKNKEIATTLSISEGTVKVYLSRLFQKVGVKDRFELALYGLRNLQNMSGEPSALNPLPSTPCWEAPEIPDRCNGCARWFLRSPPTRGSITSGVESSILTRSRASVGLARASLLRTRIFHAIALSAAAERLGRAPLSGSGRSRSLFISRLGTSTAGPAFWPRPCCTCCLRSCCPA